MKTALLHLMMPWIQRQQALENELDARDLEISRLRHRLEQQDHTAVAAQSSTYLRDLAKRYPLPPSSIDDVS